MTVLGLDYGTRRIGLAVSDEARSFAFPAGALERQSQQKDLAALTKLIRERAVEEAVVGLPLHLSGRSGPEAKAAERFAHALSQHAGIPVRMLDERWTSLEADHVLADAPRGKRRSRSRDGTRDSIAASLILRTYLDRAASGDRESSSS